MNITVKRGITGVFIIAVILLPILAFSVNNIFFIFVFASLTCLSLLEYFGLLSDSKTAHPPVAAGAFLGTSLFFTSSFVVFFGLSPYYYVLFFIGFTALFIIELYRKKTAPFQNVAYTLLGFIWIAMPFSLFNFYFIPELYNGDSHVTAMALFVFLWVNDTGAYLSGLAFGKHKLFERISPKKTWEGSIGGFVFTIATAYIVSNFWTGYSFPAWILFGSITAVAGTFGDLFESLLKRSIGCKDSGNIIPGHGGFLDRFDSFLFAAPVVLVFMIIYHFF